METQGSASHAPLAALDLLREPRKLGNLNPKSTGDAPHGAPGWVAPGLDMAQPSWMQVGSVSYLLLAEVATEPRLADGVPEGDLRV